MKIVQSFWTGNKQDIRFDYGWYSYKYHWLGWILSSNLLARNYEEVELYTDRFGFDILINKLGLPYTNVHVVLDELNHYDSDLWAMGKIKTYLLQEKTFLHVDADVFMWDPFPEAIHRSEVAVQNKEVTTDYYRDMWQMIEPLLTFLPEEMNSFKTHQSNAAYNMGIFGGNDIDFIRDYARKSVEFVDRNQTLWGNERIENFNVFFEQVLLEGCTTQASKKVTPLFDLDFGDNEYEGFGDFDYFPEEKNYLHLLGVYKRKQQICRKMETYTLKHFPEYFDALGDLTTDLKYYHSLNVRAADSLARRYEQDIGEATKTINQQQILGRDLFMTGQVMRFYDLLDDEVPFFLKRLNEMELIRSADGPTKLLIYEADEDDTTIELTNVDEILFHELGEQCIYHDLIERVLTYLDDSFSTSQIEAFEHTLVKRIECFISLKVMTPLVDHKLESFA